MTIEDLEVGTKFHLGETNILFIKVEAFGTEGAFNVEAEKVDIGNVTHVCISDVRSPAPGRRDLTGLGFRCLSNSPKPILV